MRVKSENGSSKEVHIDYTLWPNLEGQGAPASFKRLLKSCGHATNGVIALISDDKGYKRPIGMLRYGWDSLGESRVLTAAGTWVDPEYRRQGVARALWAKLIKDGDPDRVSAMAITRAGSGLLKELVRLHGPKLFGAGE